MAQKGAAGAYQQVKPRAVDYGAVSEGIADRFVAQKTQRRKEKADELAQKRKQAELDAKRFDQTFKDMTELSKLAKDFTTLKPISGARSVSSLLVENGKKEYASLIKEYGNAGYSRRIEIQDKVRQMSEWGKQWNTASTGLNEKLAQISAGMGTDYDPVLSASWTLGLTKALKSGAEIGAVKRGDNAIDIGEYITVEDVGTGALSVTFKDDKGKEIVSGSLADITAKLSGEGLSPFIDSDKEFSQTFAKGQLADILQESDPYNGLIETSRGTNEKSTKSRLRKQFNETYLATDKDGQYTNKAMRKEVALGRTPEQVRKRAVDSAWNRMRQESTEMLKSNSAYSGRKKQADIQTASDAVAAVLRGDEKAIGNLVADTPWRDPNSTIQNGKLKKVVRLDNSISVEVANTKGETEKIVYQLNDPAQMNKLINLTYSGIGKDIGVLDADVNAVSKRVFQMNLDPVKESQFTFDPVEAGEAAKKSLEDVGDDFDDVIDAISPALQTLRGAGYKVKETEGNTWKQNRIVVEDKDGKEIANVSGYTSSGFKKEIPKLIEKLLSKKEKASTETIKIKLGGKDVDMEEAIQIYKQDPRYSKVPDETLREAIKKQYKIE